MSDMIEVYTDASVKKFNNGRTFGCSYALCPTDGDFYKHIISPDSTCSKSELIGIYLGVKLAHEVLLHRMANGIGCDGINLYSDSQYGIFGLTRWMDSWLERQDFNGVLYGYEYKPVKNQEFFKAIITYLACNNLKINFYHQLGHVNFNSQDKLAQANNSFNANNGIYLRPEEIYKISFYNDIVDKRSRALVNGVDPDKYPKQNLSNNRQIMCDYVIPKNYKDYILTAKK